MRVHQQAAFVLLNRPYSESSWIVEVFSYDFGRLALIAKGARRPKSRLKGVLLPFQPLLISWSGKGELPILTSAEINLDDFDLVENELIGRALVCGFYCNELLVNLVHRHDPHQLLFDEYIATITNLSQCQSNDQLAEVLRDFEQAIVKETGYGISFNHIAGGKNQIKQDDFYRFQEGQGFVLANANDRQAVAGRVVLSLAKDSSANHSSELLSAQDKTQSKHLMRDILNQNLGYKPIVSRKLFLPRGYSENDQA